MASRKKCFVISPIGDETSAVRQEADALLWIAKNALEKYDFEVIRVDQIARTAVITNEIVQLIQESELCLIILTGQNPNVFYEAGRRHETGKPFIQMLKKDERIPFDVAGIRTIIYDSVESLASAAKIIAEVQKYVDEFEKSGYGTSGTGISMSTIALALDRIERKVGAIMSGTIGTSAGPAPIEMSGLPGDIGFGRNPREAFMQAIAQGNVEQAARLLIRLEKLLGPTRELVVAASHLCQQGYEPAAEIVFRLMDEHFDDIHKEGLAGLRSAISAIVAFYAVTDREGESIPRVEPLINKVTAVSDIDNKTKAYVLNQLGILNYGSKDYEKCLALEEQVLELAPNDTAYTYNISLTYEKLGLSQKAIEAVDRYMRHDKIAPVHFEHAVEVYLAAKRSVDARKAFAQLRSADPGKAAVLLMDDEVRIALGMQ